jgi:hypothetical protein
MRTHEFTTSATSRRRTGAALPMTLFIIVIVTMLSAGALTMTGSEYRVNDDHKTQLDTYLMAKRGMEQFIGSRASLGFTSAPPAPVESTTIAMRGGFVEVVMRQVRPPVDTTVPGLYVIRARGVRTKDGTPTGAVTGERAIAQYARFQFASLEVQSAWTAIGGLIKNGGSGTLTGYDACGMESPVSGVAVPNTPGYTQSGGGGSVPDGVPKIQHLGTVAQAAASVTIDWAGIASGSAIQPDIEYPGGSWPSSTDWADDEFWPVVRAEGNFTLPASGKGTLIVTGDLTLNGSVGWRGIVLVGGALISNGSNAVDGAVFTGLNAKLGMSVAESDLGNGTKTFRYNSCDVASAVGAFRGLVPYRNAGTDNWPAY